MERSTRLPKTRKQIINSAKRPILNLTPERKSKKLKSVQEYRDIIRAHMPYMQIHERDMTNYIIHSAIHDQIIYIQKCICKTKQRKNIISTKMRARQIISRLLLIWETRKREHDARKLQEEIKETSYRPGNTKGR